MDPLGFSQRMLSRHGPVFKFHAFGKWHVNAVGPEANELILFDADGRFSASGGWEQIIAPVFPGALLILDGPAHRAARRLMGEAFRHQQLAGYRGLFAADIGRAVGSWSGRTVDVYAEVKGMTFDIAASTFLGVAEREDAVRAVELLRRMIASLLAMVDRPLPSLVRFRGSLAKRELDALLRDLVEARRAAPGDDFLSRVAALRDDDGRPLDVQAICDAFSFLMSAAHDTMASSLTSLLYYLAVERDWSVALREELDRAGVGDPIEAASADLPLLDMFYKETLRLNGPAPVVWRRAVRDFELLGHRVPAGTMTGANLMLAHRLPELWPDPERFDPHRFSPVAEAGRSRFAYTPFGGGVHKCLGMHFALQQGRIFVAHLLRHADLRLAQDAPVAWYQWPNCRPRRPFRVEVHPRRRGT